MTFSSSLISWYEVNKRDLPFRGTKDPYLIWVSEVILQQTRMEQGVTYYLRFIEQFPDIRSLAAASEEEVLKTWQGMGYYSRARNLHASALEIRENFGGKFPATYLQIVKLKGIGDYSAASIASLAFGEPQAAIDGNVYRFITRYFGFRDEVGSASGKKRTREKANSLMDKNQPGIFNQAMIEFGALICTPQKPSCHNCIFNTSCYAFKHKLILKIPVKKKKVFIRKRYLNYLVMTFPERGKPRVILNKRSEEDIWKNLYDFPVIESMVRLSSSGLRKTDEWKRIFHGKKPSVINISEEFRHILSHQVILATFYHISLEEPPEGFDIRLPLDQMNSVPLPRLITRYIQKYFQG
ncbi:MAG: A/G-specific adenine glycosylase [Bacteroidales bacterium]|nr:A/G-specific adenine glycosylase [Bacteroidales bacterium]